MSHQTSAWTLVFPFHTIELMPAYRQPRAVQAMYMQVPVFHAGGIISASTLCSCKSE